jgi:hypothetical protein
MISTCNGADGSFLSTAPLTEPAGPPPFTLACGLGLRPLALSFSSGCARGRNETAAVSSEAGRRASRSSDSPRPWPCCAIVRRRRRAARPSSAASQESLRARRGRRGRQPRMPGCSPRWFSRFAHENLRVSALAAKAVGSARFVRHRFPEWVGQAVAFKHLATIGTMRHCA